MSKKIKFTLIASILFLVASGFSGCNVTEKKGEFHVGQRVIPSGHVHLQAVYGTDNFGSCLTKEPGVVDETSFIWGVQVIRVISDPDVLDSVCRGWEASSNFLLAPIVLPED